jgi:CheY-like chemotaxis protein
MPRSLLLIEDNEDDVFFFQVAMRKLALPYRLVLASDGREGLRQLQESVADSPEVGPFGLVLLDLKLPFVDGFEVLAGMHSLPPGRCPPVVVLTTSEKQSDVQLAWRLGASAVLVKPNRPDQLVELLRLLDAKWLSDPPVPPAPTGHSLRPAEVVK